VITTPSGRDFADVTALGQLSGHPVRSAWRQPGEPRSATRSDVIVLAPATYNTINKLAAGISDNYALGVLAEAPGLRIPVIIAPFVNAALASRRAYQRSLTQLRQEGIRILDGDGQIRPTRPAPAVRSPNGFPGTSPSTRRAATSVSLLRPRFAGSRRWDGAGDLPAAYPAGCGPRRLAIPIAHARRGR